MGEYIQALHKVDDQSQTIIADMIARHRKVLIMSYAPVIILVLIASIMFSVLVLSGKTEFPVWIATINPVTVTILWLLIKRFLSQFVHDWTEGAGFNLANPIFFALTTIMLWNG